MIWYYIHIYSNGTYLEIISWIIDILSWLLWSVLHVLNRSIIFILMWLWAYHSHFMHTHSLNISIIEEHWDWKKIYQFWKTLGWGYCRQGWSWCFGNPMPRSFTCKIELILIKYSSCEPLMGAILEVLRLGKCIWNILSLFALHCSHYLYFLYVFISMSLVSMCLLMCRSLFTL